MRYDYWFCIDKITTHCIWHIIYLCVTLHVSFYTFPFWRSDIWQTYNSYSRGN